MAFVLVTLICSPFNLQNISKATNRCYNPSALWETRTASSAKAKKKICKVANSSTYRLVGLILFFSKYSNKYGYTWSKKIQNSLGDAPSPYFTPVFASKLFYFYPGMFTIPLFYMYIFLIILIKHGGIFNVTAMSSHRALRSTRL